MDFKQEIEQLRKELNEHSYRYYVQDAPVIWKSWRRNILN